MDQIILLWRALVLYLHLSCGDLSGDWIRVPGNVAYEGRDFCVMKYEAKEESDGSGGSTPTSEPAGTPWWISSKK